MDFNPNETLRWCADEGVAFKIVNKDGTPTIEARLGQVFATYPAKPSLTNAVWAALHSVYHGTEFHREYGLYPTSKAKSAGSSVDNSNIPSDGSPEESVTTSNLHSNDVP
jgi:hypothetical protein